jgi:uncharacterized protein YecE (DUF72 family)
MTEIRVGTCGFCLPRKEYFGTFGLIEIQHTFYRPPQIETVRRWRAAAPSEFEFTLKAFQAITHPGTSPTYRRSTLSPADRLKCGSFRNTAQVRDAWQKTRALALELAASFVIFQCPRRFTPNDENVANLRRFFTWARRDGLVFGWEPRGQDWTPELVRSLCRDLDLIHVVDPFQCAATHGRLHYFRLHRAQDYNYRFKNHELEQLQSMCTAPVNYCMFNNTFMLDDARRFQNLVGKRG